MAIVALLRILRSHAAEKGILSKKRPTSTHIIGLLTKSVKVEEGASDVPAVGEVGTVNAVHKDQLVAGPAERKSIERW